MGVSKESISKFLIGNRFHVKLRILSPYSIICLNKDWECVISREIDFLLKICWSIPCLHPSWKVHTWVEIYASLNHGKKTKADGSRLIPRKHTETLVLLSVPRIVLRYVCSCKDWPIRMHCIQMFSCHVVLVAYVPQWVQVALKRMRS